jgi:hypothetical protein
LKTVTPLNINITIAIESELKSRISEQDQLQQKQVERAKYEADLARRRFMQVDPDNRLVATSLEADWNERLREHKVELEDYEKQKKNNYSILAQNQIEDIRRLAKDFPKVWHAKSTSNKEKKRLTRLIIEDVTLLRSKQIILQIRFKGGKSTTLHLPLPLSSNELRKTDETVIKEIDKLLSHYILSEVATELNKQGYRSGCGKKFHYKIVYLISKKYGLKTRYDRLRESGLMTADEVSAMLNVKVSTIKKWRLNGLLKYKVYNEKRGCLYEIPGDDAPVKHKSKYVKMKENNKVVTNRSNEVQYAT